MSRAPCSRGPRIGQIYGHGNYENHTDCDCEPGTCAWEAFRRHSSYSSDQRPLQLYEGLQVGQWITRIEECANGDWLAHIVSVGTTLGRVAGVCVPSGPQTFKTRALAQAEADRLLTI